MCKFVETRKTILGLLFDKYCTEQFLRGMLAPGKDLDFTTDLHTGRFLN